MRKTLQQRIDESFIELQEAQKRYDSLMSQFNEQEVKAKNKRIAERGAYIEKALPGIITLNKQQFETFVEKVLLTPQTNRILEEICAELETVINPVNDAETNPDSNNTVNNLTENTEQANDPSVQKHTEPIRNGNTNSNGSGYNNTRQQYNQSAQKHISPSHNGNKSGNGNGGNSTGQQA